MIGVLRVLQTFWWYLREVCGENDYAQYQARARRQGTEPVPRDKFYLAQLRRKYSRVSRCC